MMSNETMQNLMEDADDEGLQAVMGSKFQDLSQATGNLNTPERLRPVKNHPKEDYPSSLGTLSDKPSRVPDGEWIQLNRVSPMAKLKECAKGAGLYGGISLLLFWWQQTGLLASEAAIPSFIVLALLAGVKFGSVCRG